jgi:hypothetical protein
MLYGEKTGALSQYTLDIGHTEEGEKTGALSQYTLDIGHTEEGDPG